MKSFSTSDMMDLGVPEIDAQHKKLLHFIKDMGLAIGTAEEEKVMKSIILQMADYSLKHFTFESGLMKNDEYKGLHGHLELHRQYNDKVKDFAIRYGQKRDLKAAELVSWLWEWWMNHIQVHDRIWATEHVAKEIKD